MFFLVVKHQWLLVGTRIRRICWMQFQLRWVVSRDMRGYALLPDPNCNPKQVVHPNQNQLYSLISYEILWNLHYITIQSLRVLTSMYSNSSKISNKWWFPEIGVPPHHFALWTINSDLVVNHGIYSTPSHHPFLGFGICHYKPFWIPPLLETP